MKITLAGVPGSGKSTLRKALATHFNLETKATGDFMRSKALEYGYHDITKFVKEYISQHPEIDREVDEAQKQFGQENDNFVLDAHIGFLFVPDSIKIFLQCDSEITAKRILAAKRATEAAQDLQSAIAANQTRIQTMRENFQKLYNVDMHDKNNFDFVLDTTHLTPKQVSQQVIEFIESQIS